MKIHLYRAGTTDWDEERRLQGTLQVPLNQKGKAEVISTLEKDDRPAVREIWCGFAQSAVQTGQLVSRRINCPLFKSEAFNEIDLGMWQGMLESDLKIRHRRAWVVWMTQPQSVLPPRGESLRDAQARILDALAELMQDNAKGLAVVLPRMAFRLAQCHFEDLGLMKFWEDQSYGFVRRTFERG